MGLEGRYGIAGIVRREKGAGEKREVGGLVSIGGGGV